MQSDRQHIDDFFRAKEEAWDAGTGDLQKHWQEMLPLMLMSRPVSKPTYYRLLKWLSGMVALSVFIAWLVIFSKEKETVEQKLPQTNNKHNALNAVAPPPVLQKDTVAEMPLPTVMGDHIEIITDSCYSVEDEAMSDPALLMTNFYTAIKKEEQSFSIPADRDTTIIGKEGTILTIKAKTFTGINGPIYSGRLTVKLTEYYQFDDMLAAKLNTVSGGQQLVTGGMVHLQAEIEGQPVQVVSDKRIELKMPTDKYDQDMQLFIDTAARDGSQVNWMPAGQSQRLFENATRPIEVIDITVSPYRVSSRKNKAVGKFFYSPWPGFNKKILQEELLKRNVNVLDKIKLRKAGRKERREIIQEKFMPFEEAVAAGLVFSDDSARYFKQAAKDSARYAEQLGKLKYYRFQLNTLGWINCDRFYRDPRPLTNLTINLGAGYNAGEFQSHLVFTRLRSVMNGLYIGSRIQFRSIPENEPVQLVSIGVKDGKVVSSITPYIIGKGEQKTPVFEETSPEAFKQKLELLNKPDSPQ